MLFICTNNNIFVCLVIYLLNIKYIQWKKLELNYNNYIRKKSVNKNNFI